MLRRGFLGVISGGATAGLTGGCASSTLKSVPERVPPKRSKLRAVCFDLFTLFDPRPVVAAARNQVGERAEALCEVWRTKQFGNAWLRAAAGQYLDFRSVTYQALVAAERTQNLTLGEATRNALVDEYSRLPPWPDTRDTLARLGQAGVRLATLANYSPEMMKRLIANAGLTHAFDALISTDDAATFKPAPQAYALGPRVLGLKREEIAFSAFGAWDAAGAKWFGFPTFWVNRLGAAPEELPPGPDATGATLWELAAFVDAW